MKITNKHGLPQAVYQMLAKERYSGGVGTDYSVTTLLQPPRITQLKRRHSEDIEEDCIDRLWSLFGNIAHSLLEEHGADNAMSEERISTNILNRVISGQVDSYHEGKITDYKVTSAWTLVYGSRLHEWTEQLNLYSFLFQEAGHEVKELQICAILRDWDKNKAKQDSSYPQTPIVIIPIPLWDYKKAETFAVQRTQYHILNEDLDDNELWECSEEEMWSQPTKYAVMKEGAKRATRVLDSEEEAKEYVGEDSKLSIAVRKGKRTRCLDYCSVNKFCSCYQNYLKESENE